MSGYHWWVLLVATLGWLFDSMDQRLFVLTRTPALRELLPYVSEVRLADYAGYATAIFVLGWASGTRGRPRRSASSYRDLGA